MYVMKYSNKIFFYFYICLIFILSCLPIITIHGTYIIGIDKLLHLIEYFILGFLYRHYIINKVSIFNFCFYYILIIPIVDEFLIQNISSRTVDYWDFIFNVIGLYLGIIIRNYFDKKTYN